MTTSILQAFYKKNAFLEKAQKSPPHYVFIVNDTTVVGRDGITCLLPMPLVYFYGTIQYYIARIVNKIIRSYPIRKEIVYND